MAANLKGRLARLRALGLTPASEAPSPPLAGPAARPRGQAAPGPRLAAGKVPSFLRGWERIGDLVWSRELRFDLSFPEALDPRPFRLGRRRGAGPGEPPRGGSSPAAPGGPPAEGPIPREALRFFDFETSGLSGGAGTVAFLAAVGRCEGSDFLVRQLFLEDYPGEAWYLEALLEALGASPGEGPGESVALTYNGKAFDLPLLRTRCIMNGIPPPALRDLDALACARRLWRRVLGGASLGLVEREVLGVERGSDLPGSEIPAVWFEYLRRGDHPLMPAVMAHNASDVWTLAAVAARIDSAFARPGRLDPLAAMDRAGLGRGLLLMGRDAEGEELLEAAAGEGDEGAGLLLSRRYRRQGRLEDRRRILDALPETYASCVERAKFHEHAARDIGSALAWARAARRAAGPDELEEVGARIARLERKAGLSREG